MKKMNMGAGHKHHDEGPYTPDGKLTESGKKMLRDMLKPDPMKLPDDERRHAFIMCGSETLFLVHMTMFHMEEHCYQLILHASLPDADIQRFREWRAAKPTQAYFLANLTESALDVPQLATGEMGSFYAEVFEGIPPKDEYTEWPWGGVKPVMARVQVKVERVVYFRHFDYNFNYPASLSYVLFGAGKEAHMQSFQTKEPDYDHILSLAAAPGWLPAVKLASAVTVNFPRLRERPVLKNPLRKGRHQVAYQGFRDYLEYRFAPLHPIEAGTTWWFHTSPLNLVPPELRLPRRKRK